MKELFVQVKGLIEKGWHKGSYYRDKFGNICSKDAAESYCLLGAIRIVGNYPDPLCFELGVVVADKLSGEFISRWQDDPERTKQDVLDLLDSVIEDVV